MWLNVLNSTIEEFKSQSLHALREILSDYSQPPLRRMAAQAAVECREIEPSQKAEIVVLALADPDQEVKRFGIYYLGRIKDPRFVPALRDLLSDPSPLIQAEVIRSLAILGDPEACNACAHLISHSPSPMLREVAVVALGFLGTPQALDLLELLLNSGENEEMRILAGTILAGKGSRLSEQFLEQKLNQNGDLEIKIAIAVALSELRNQAGLCELKSLVQALTSSRSSESDLNILRWHIEKVLRIGSTAQDKESWRKAVEAWIENSQDR